MEIQLLKVNDLTFMVDSDDVKSLSHIEKGEYFTVEYKKKRNLKFHRKFFALLDLAFDCWEPDQVTHKGEMVAKNKERFRKDIIILAGYYEVVFNIRGAVRYEAKSIAFGNTDETEFSAIYSKVVDVILAKVLKNYTREDIDKVVDKLLGFT